MNIYLIIYWVIFLLLLASGVFLFYVSYKFTKADQKSIDWSKQGSSWIIGALPYWFLKLLWFLLGVLCVYVSIGYLYNVILFPI